MGVESDPVLMGAGTGAASGAMMGGMMGGPWGALAGGVVGGGIGALGGMGQAGAAKDAKKALKKQQAAIAAEQVRRAQGVGAARQTFGDINSFGQAFQSIGGAQGPQDPSRFQDIGKTLNARSSIQGNIDTQAQAVRDQGMQGLTSTAQQGAAQLRQESAGRGLMGSSLDTGAKQMLLAQYAGGKANVAGAVDATKQAGWGAIKGQQAAFENAASQGGNINGVLAANSNAGAIAGARSQQPYALMGNMLNMGMGVLGAGAKAEAQGGAGLTAFGLPSMGLSTPSNRPQGASLSKGT